MKRAPIRSTVFNLLFYGFTAVACVICLPTLVLPRRYFMAVVDFFVHGVHFLEKNVLGLRYEVLGAENLPTSGAYIVAAKHQSAYETMKLHILFKDPAVILKKELLAIPLWGQYLGKSAPIAIDRSNKEAAAVSIQEGAKRVQAEGRPIVIFPQGTRVLPEDTTQQKPYKIGVARIQEATGLPIIPMAMNAGLFWPRRGWRKSSGVVTFKFLPAIAAGQDRKDLMAELEKGIESESNELMAEARERKPEKSKHPVLAMLGMVILIIGAAAAYSFYWHKVAESVTAEYVRFVADVRKIDPASVTPPEIKGFPLQMHLFAPIEERFSDAQNTVTIQNLVAHAWPIPAAPIHIFTGPIEVKNFRWKAPISFTSFEGTLTERKNVLTFSKAELRGQDFMADMAGTFDLNQKPIPAPDLKVAIHKHNNLIQMLMQAGIVDARMGLFLGSGLTNFADEYGVITVPIYQRGEMLNAGPIPIMRLPISRESLAPDSRSPLVPTP